MKPYEIYKKHEVEQSISKKEALKELKINLKKEGKLFRHFLYFWTWCFSGYSWTEQTWDHHLNKLFEALKESKVSGDKKIKRIDRKNHIKRHRMASVNGRRNV